MSKYVIGHAHLHQSVWHFRFWLILVPRACTPILVKFCPLGFQIHICCVPYGSGSKCFGRLIPNQRLMFRPKFMMIEQMELSESSVRKTVFCMLRSVVLFLKPSVIPIPHASSLIFPCCHCPGPSTEMSAVDISWSLLTNNTVTHLHFQPIILQLSF